MGIRVAAGWVAAALLAPVIAAADDALTLADLARGDQVRLQLTSGGRTVRGTIDAHGAGRDRRAPEGPGAAAAAWCRRRWRSSRWCAGATHTGAEGALIGFVPGAVLVGLAAGGAGGVRPGLRPGGFRSWLGALRGGRAHGHAGGPRRPGRQDGPLGARPGAAAQAGAPPGSDEGWLPRAGLSLGF